MTTVLFNVNHGGKKEGQQTTMMLCYVLDDSFSIQEGFAKWFAQNYSGDYDWARDTNVFANGTY